MVQLFFVTSVGYTSHSRVIGLIGKPKSARLTNRQKYKLILDELRLYLKFCCKDFHMSDCLFDC